MVKFCNPLEDTYRITSKYGMRLHPIKKVYRIHAGIDIVDDKRRKVPVHTIASGVVTKVESKTTGYGKHVIISHVIDGVKYDSNYAHLDRIDVKLNQKVSQGEQIGILGNSGGSTANHLHIGLNTPVYKYDGGNYPNSVDILKHLDLNFKPSQARKSTTSPTQSTSKSNETITSYLEKYGLDSSFTYRKELASLYKISNYTGTVNQNNILLSKLQNDTSVTFRFYSGEVKDETTANKVKDKINSKQPSWTIHIIQLANKKWKVKSGTYKTFDSVAQASQTVNKLGYSVHIKED